MYVMVRRYDGITDPAEVTRRVEEGLVPWLKQTTGFLAYYWVDAGDGVGIATLVFESHDGFEELESHASDWQAENLKPLLPNPPQVTDGTVTVVAQGA